MQKTVCNNSTTRSPAHFFSLHFLRRLFLLCLVLAQSWMVPAQQSKTIEPCAAPAIRSAQQSKAIEPCQPPTSKSAPGVFGTPSSSETLVDERISDDPTLLKILELYSAKVRELENVIGKLEGELRKTGVGAGSMGNFVTDGLRAEAELKTGKYVDLMISNSGGLRKSAIAEGQLRVKDIFELLPFDNALIAMDLTGDQVITLLSVIVADRDAQSGARITYRLNTQNRPELVSAKLVDAQGREKEIDPNGIYWVASIDYLYKLGPGRYSILREGKNFRALGITVRDAMIEYIKSRTAKGLPVRAVLDERFKQIGSGQNNTEPQ